MRGSRRSWLVVVLVLIIVVLAAYWMNQYSAHSTPERALVAYDSTVGPIETIPFGRGVVLITPSDQKHGFTAWYMTKGLWGWRAQVISSATIGLAPENYNVDFQSFALDGETFIWGTSITPMKEIVYHAKGKTFTSQVGNHPVWHMILPVIQTIFLHSDWTMLLPDGNTAPLFK
jgi:hypothetical protein